MRLINTNTLELEECFGDDIPRYAILSHTWGKEEVSYQDWQNLSQRSAKKGYQKIRASCDVARDSFDMKYLWVDTNCINKDSSAELTEAINSMFTWYRNAYVCLVYLEDFEYHDHNLEGLEHCRYWTRGWTLQELLAPTMLQFYDSKWQSFGTKDELVDKISNITSIPAPCLFSSRSLRDASIASKMSWAAHRKTTRAEDMAYCLMGIFDINMPLLYGEGEKAFIRLQEEIIKHSNDQTIFYDVSEFHLTNSGLRIGLPLLETITRGPTLAPIKVVDERDTESDSEDWRYCVCLLRFEGNTFIRRDEFRGLLRIPQEWVDAVEETQVYLVHRRNPVSQYLPAKGARPLLCPRLKQRYAILPIYPPSNNEVIPLLQHEWRLPHQDTVAGMIGLEKLEVQSEDMWYAQATFKSPKYQRLNIDILVHMPSSGAAEWNTTVRIQAEGESKAPSTVQKISLPKDLEFEVPKVDNLVQEVQKEGIQIQDLQKKRMKTRVRSLLISFTEYLEKERVWWNGGKVRGRKAK